MNYLRIYGEKELLIEGNKLSISTSTYWCPECSDGVIVYEVNLVGSPTGSTSFDLKRSGSCCGVSIPCVAFSIKLDTLSSGVDVTINGSIADDNFKLNCQYILCDNGRIYIDGGTVNNLLTYTKPGLNIATYSFTAFI